MRYINCQKCGKSFKESEKEWDLITASKSCSRCLNMTKPRNTMNGSMKLFVIPILWLVFYFSALVLLDIFIGPSHPSGELVGFLFLYAILLSPIIGIAGIVYSVRKKDENPRVAYVLSLLLNCIPILLPVLHEFFMNLILKLSRI